jgi:hypothetical protein
VDEVASARSARLASTARGRAREANRRFVSKQKNRLAYTYVLATKSNGVFILLLCSFLFRYCHCFIRCVFQCVGGSLSFAFKYDVVEVCIMTALSIFRCCCCYYVSCHATVVLSFYVLLVVCFSLYTGLLHILLYVILCVVSHMCTLLYICTYICIYIATRGIHRCI